jgi:hypothetical protein
MTDNIENIILEHLRAIRADINSIRDDIREMKHRMIRLDGSMAGVKKDAAVQYETTATQHAAYDRLAERVERIERRLDISDA